MKKGFLMFLILLLILGACVFATCSQETRNANDADDDADDDDDTDDDADDDVDDDAGIEYAALFITNPSINETGEYVIKTQEEWDEFLGNVTKGRGLEIDFNKQMVVGVVVGAGGCAALGAILNIWEDEGYLNFEYIFAGDGPCYCYPLLPIFAIVPKSDLPVRFKAHAVENERRIGLTKGEFAHTPFFINNCLIQDEDEFVIRTQKEWEQFLGYSEGDTAFEIDFTERMVIGVVAGAGGCAALGRIVDISEGDDAIVFEYDLTGIGLCDMWVLVQIFAIIEKSELPVEFLGP